ncbi:MAG: cytochrome c maturation protein CcmE [Bacteroidia bacterium]|nr:cytochrome c maturation protein CcmE [Bacteroidia bacterium]
MKKIYIVAIVILAVAVVVIMMSLKNTTTYSDCTEAAENPEKEFHIVGKLDKTQAQVYEPTINPDEFSFYLTDNKGATKQVVLHKSKPQDFDKSEQIVLIGTMRNDVFHANDILLKCPSKYNDGVPQAQ